MGLPGSLLFRGDGDRMDPSSTMRAWPFWSLPHAGWTPLGVLPSLPPHPHPIRKKALPC